MNDRLALRVLAEIMCWSDGQATDEYRYLTWMAAAKYDSYQDFVAGGRFLEHLVRWLQQFTPADRAAAYRLVRERMIFVSAAEMQRLIDLFYPQVVEPLLVAEVSLRRELPPWRVWADADARSDVAALGRKCLYMGLSEGARLDRLRRLNEGRISNEQVVLQTQLDEDKWDDMTRELRASLGTDDAGFEFVFLVDDFIGSGTSLLRHDGGRWKGKLPRFAKVLEHVPAGSLTPCFRLNVHHYLANGRVLDAALERWAAWRDAEPAGPLPAFASFTSGSSLPQSSALDDERDPDLLDLADRYYSARIETESMRKGGDHARRGFAHCALPLVIEHNTPNNSIPLLWAHADAAGPGQHNMRPLFYRRQRHG